MQVSADDADVAVGVDEIAVHRVTLDGVDHQRHVVHCQSTQQVDEDGAAQEARGVVLEVAVGHHGVAALNACAAALADQRYHSLATVGVDPDLHARMHIRIPYIHRCCTAYVSVQFCSGPRRSIITLRAS